MGLIRHRHWSESIVCNESKAPEVFPYPPQVKCAVQRCKHLLFPSSPALALEHNLMVMAALAGRPDEKAAGGPRRQWSSVARDSSGGAAAGGVRQAGIVVNGCDEFVHLSKKL